ncbi:MAG: esterase-like activity of phytase family protein [Cyanobium sp.]
MLAVLGLVLVSPGAIAAPLLPCPLSAGWQLASQRELPRQNAKAEPIGGFSAAHWSPSEGSLLLLSDLPKGSLARWSWRKADSPPLLLNQIPLRSDPAQELPEADAEGLVALAGQWWVASEGRRRADRPAQLLRFSAPGGVLLEALPLPEHWQPAPGRGLASNGGPESLLLLPGSSTAEPPALLMAAEIPLLQDPPRLVRLLRWWWPAGADPARTTPKPSAQGALELPEGEGWGLTDLLALGPHQLLALLRRFEAPDRWQIRLALYPLPPAGNSAAAPPLAEWDLITIGLIPDNWEALAPGPTLSDGRPTLLLASDDNLNPLQANRLALLTPKRDGCNGSGR